MTETGASGLEIRYRRYCRSSAATSFEVLYSIVRRRSPSCSRPTSKCVIGARSDLMWREYVRGEAWSRPAPPHASGSTRCGQRYSFRKLASIRRGLNRYWDFARRSTFQKGCDARRCGLRYITMIRVLHFDNAICPYDVVDTALQRFDRAKI